MYDIFPSGREIMLGLICFALVIAACAIGLWEVVQWLWGAIDLSIFQ